MNTETKDFIAMMKQYSENNRGLKEIGKQIDKLITLLTFKDAEGKSFSAFIHGRPVIGKIRIYDNEIILCQNILAGIGIPESLKYGYKYSFTLGSGSREAMLQEGVSKFQIIEPRMQPKESSPKPEPKEERDFEVNDILKFQDGTLQTVVAKIGDLIFTIMEKGTIKEEACGPFTSKELRNHGVVAMPKVRLGIFSAPTFSAPRQAYLVGELAMLQAMMNEMVVSDIFRRLKHR